MAGDATGVSRVCVSVGKYVVVCAYAAAGPYLCPAGHLSNEPRLVFTLGL